MPQAIIEYLTGILLSRLQRDQVHLMQIVEDIENQQYFMDASQIGNYGKLMMVTRAL